MESKTKMIRDYQNRNTLAMLMVLQGLVAIKHEILGECIYLLLSNRRIFVPRLHDNLIPDTLQYSFVFITTKHWPLTDKTKRDCAGNPSRTFGCSSSIQKLFLKLLLIPFFLTLILRNFNKLSICIIDSFR